jgi:integrase
MAAMAKRSPQGFYKRNRKWYVRTDPVTGEARTTGCTDIEAAKAWRRERERLAADPNYAAETEEGINYWAIKLIELKRRNRSAATVSFYSQKLGHIVRFFGADSPASSMRPGRFDDYVVQRRDEGATDHTISKEIKAAQQLAKFAKRGGAFRGDPSTFKPMDFNPQYEPRTTFATPEQLIKLLDVLSHKRAAHVALSVAVGPRLSEAFRVERSDVDLDNWTVMVRGTKTKKSRARIPIAEPFRQLLVAALPFLPLEPWGNMTRDLAAACKRAGIPKLTSNDLRRTHGSWLKEAGVSSSLIADTLRHSDERMVRMVYGQARPEKLGQAIAGQIAAAQTLQLAAKTDTYEKNDSENDSKSAESQEIVQVAQSVEQRTEKPVFRSSQATEIARSPEGTLGSERPNSPNSDAAYRSVRSRNVTRDGLSRLALGYAALRLGLLAEVA